MVFQEVLKASACRTGVDMVVLTFYKRCMSPKATPILEGRPLPHIRKGYFLCGCYHAAENTIIGGGLERERKHNTVPEGMVSPCMMIVN